VFLQELLASKYLILISKNFDSETLIHHELENLLMPYIYIVTRFCIKANTRNYGRILNSEVSVVLR
jgi:hypothetical protein